MTRKRNTERGSVSVEFALVMPLLLLVIIGGVHFGRVVMTRHKLTDATNYAIRSASVAHSSSAPQIRTLIEDRLGGPASGCLTVDVNAVVAADAIGLDSLVVTATCNLTPAFGGAFLGGIGPASLTVSAAMPF